MVIERNLVNMTTSRFFRYLRKVDEEARYEALPIPAEDVWERYGRMKPTRFSVTLSSITNPADIEGPVGAILDSGQRLHEMIEGPTVHLSVYSGGKPDGLNKGMIGRIIEGLLDSNEQGYEVTALSVSAEDEDDEASHVLNFLRDILLHSDEIDLDGVSSEVSFTRRIAFLRACYGEHMDYIVKHHEQA